MRQALIDEFSYASETHSLGRILAIRAVESLSGQPFLKKLYLDYQSENLPLTDFGTRLLRGSTWMCISMPAVPPMCVKPARWLLWPITLMGCWTASPFAGWWRSAARLQNSHQ